MDLQKAKEILTLVANDPHHGYRGAWEDQDIAARVILKELRRLERENRALKRELQSKGTGDRADGAAGGPENEREA